MRHHRAGGHGIVGDEGRNSFWTTLPGILTGIAALLTAVVGLVTALHSGGGPSKINELPPQSSSTAVRSTDHPSAAAPGPFPQDRSRATIVNQNSDKCIDVVAGSTADGAPVVQFTCNGGSNQIWTMERGSIVNLRSHKCLEVAESGLQEGARVQQWACTGGANQRWLATSEGELMNEKSRECLGVPSGSAEDRVPLFQWRCNQHTSQHWSFQSQTQTHAVSR